MRKRRGRSAVAIGGTETSTLGGATLADFDVCPKRFHDRQRLRRSARRWSATMVAAAAGTVAVIGWLAADYQRVARSRRAMVERYLPAVQWRTRAGTWRRQTRLADAAADRFEAEIAARFDAARTVGEIAGAAAADGIRLRRLSIRLHDVDRSAVTLAGATGGASGVDVGENPGRTVGGFEAMVVGDAAATRQMADRLATVAQVRRVAQQGPNSLRGELVRGVWSEGASPDQESDESVRNARIDTGRSEIAAASGDAGAVGDG